MQSKTSKTLAGSEEEIILISIDRNCKNEVDALFLQFLIFYFK